MEDRASEFPRIRYWILNILSPAYPNPVDFLLLRKTLSNFGFAMSDRDLCAFVSYLKERGYVTITEHEAYRLRMVAITADGLDCLDGRRQDSGVSRA